MNDHPDNRAFRALNKLFNPWLDEWQGYTQVQKDESVAKIATAQVPQVFGFGHDEQAEFEDRDQDYPEGMKR